MKLRKLIGGLTLGIVAISSAIAGFVSVKNKVVSEPVMTEAGTATATTIYLAIPSSVVGSKHIMVRVNYQGNNNWWENACEMQNTGYKYGGNPIYKGNFTDKYGGLGALYFNICNNTSDTEATVYNKAFGNQSWTDVSTYNGKMYVWNNSNYNSPTLTSYSTDTNSYVFYFDQSGWNNSTTPKLYWWDNYSHNGTITNPTNVTTVASGGTYANTKWYKFTFSNAAKVTGLKFFQGTSISSTSKATGDITQSLTNNTVFGTTGSAGNYTYGTNSDGKIYKIIRYRKLGSASATQYDINYTLGGESWNPGNPSSVAPTNYLIDGTDVWYPNSSFSGSTTYNESNWVLASGGADINLYAKYKDEPATGYYMVGDANFMTQFGTSGDAFSFDSGVLMNTATAPNHALYTFTNTITITMKGRYYSHSSSWWADYQVEISDSARAKGADFDGSGNYVVPAGTWSFYIFEKDGYESSSLTWGVPLDSYCAEFLSQTGAVCNGDSTVRATLLSTMSNLEADWAFVSTEDRTTLRTALANESGNASQQVAARYDFILGKYGYSAATGDFHDFMSRTPAKRSNLGIHILFGSANDSNNSTVVIIIVSTLVAVSAVGGYFLLRKRKEQ